MGLFDGEGLNRGTRLICGTYVRNRSVSATKDFVMRLPYTTAHISAGTMDAFGHCKAECAIPSEYDIERCEKIGDKRLTCCCHNDCNSIEALQDQVERQFFGQGLVTTCRGLFGTASATGMEH